MDPQNSPDQTLREALDLIGRPVAWRYPTNVVAKVLGVHTATIRKRIKLQPGSPSRIEAVQMGSRHYMSHTELLRLLAGE